MLHLHTGKLEVIKDLCRELGVHTEPERIGGVWIAPIYSWYHASFDREPDLRGAPAVEKACLCLLLSTVANQQVYR